MFSLPSRTPPLQASPMGMLGWGMTLNGGGDLSGGLGMGLGAGGSGGGGSNEPASGRNEGPGTPTSTSVFNPLRPLHTIPRPLPQPAYYNFIPTASLSPLPPFSHSRSSATLPSLSTC
jgi:hypothetical protein